MHSHSDRQVDRRVMPGSRVGKEGEALRAGLMEMGILGGELGMDGWIWGWESGDPEVSEGGSAVAGTFFLFGGRGREGITVLFLEGLAGCWVRRFCT